MAITTGGSGLLIDCNVFSTDGLLDHGHSPVIWLAKCFTAAKWPTDWTKETRGWLDIALAQTQLEVSDILCSFPACTVPHAMTRLFKKALWGEQMGQLNTRNMVYCCHGTECGEKMLPLTAECCHVMKMYFRVIFRINRFYHPFTTSCPQL